MDVVHVPRTYRCRLDRGSGGPLTFMAAVAVAAEPSAAARGNDRVRNRGNGRRRGGAQLTRWRTIEIQ